MTSLYPICSVIGVAGGSILIQLIWQGPILILFTYAKHEPFISPEAISIGRVIYTVNQKNTPKCFLIYSLQNLTDGDKIWYILENV